MSYLGFLDWSLKKILSFLNIVIFEINVLKIVKMQTFVQKYEFLNLEPKMPFFVVLDSNFEKKIVTLRVSPLEFFSLKRGYLKNYVCLKVSIFDLFVCLTPPTSPYVCFSELPPLPPQKKFCNAYEFSNEKSESEKREKIFFFFCKLSIKEQPFRHSYIYKDNKNI